MFFSCENKYVVFDAGILSQVKTDRWLLWKVTQKRQREWFRHLTSLF